MPTVIVDFDLGRVRYCAGCDEWWPNDEEFFAGPEARWCHACVADRDAHIRRLNAERQQRYRERQRAAAT